MRAPTIWTLALGNYPYGAVPTPGVVNSTLQSIYGLSSSVKGLCAGLHILLRVVASTTLPLDLVCTNISANLRTDYER
jgi:hypothetical protein